MAKAPPVFMKAQRKPWANNTDVKRLFKGRALQREREALFNAEPFCRECRKQGKLVLATIRDHILALAFGGLDVRENTQPLCKPCSDAKTGRESRRGTMQTRSSPSPRT